MSSSFHLYDNHLEQDQVFYVIGDRVLVDGHKPASVAYFGEVEFSSGDWVGCVLDMPTGKHDGKLHGHRYFQCAPKHGLFVRPHRLNRLSPSDDLATYSNSSSRVTTPYMYDEDYRNANTISDLEQKLKSFDKQQQQQKKGILKKTSKYSSSSSSRSSPNFDNSDTYSRSLSRLSSIDERTKSPVYSFRPSRSQLLENGERAKLTRSSSSLDLSSKPLCRGDRVVVRTDYGNALGTLRYLGETEFATGEWAGVELDKADGKNDGCVLSVRYFHCPQNHGLFVPATRVKPYDGNDVASSLMDDFNRIKSTIKSPPPQYNRHRGYESNRSFDTSPSSYDSGNYFSSSTTSSPLRSHSRSMFSETPLPELKTNTIDPEPKLGDSSWIERSMMDYRPKFDEKDIDYQLKKSLQRSATTTTAAPIRRLTTSLSDYHNRPKSVKYTFSSSKYDGNPIAWRTVVYN